MIEIMKGAIPFVIMISQICQHTHKLIKRYVKVIKNVHFTKNLINKNCFLLIRNFWQIKIKTIKRGYRIFLILIYLTKIVKKYLIFLSLLIKILFLNPSVKIFSNLNF